jgi:hypothetical protein
MASTVKIVLFLMLLAVPVYAEYVYNFNGDSNIATYHTEIYNDSLLTDTWLIGLRWDGDYPDTVKVIMHNEISDTDKARIQTIISQ